MQIPTAPRLSIECWEMLAWAWWNVIKLSTIDQSYMLFQVIWIKIGHIYNELICMHAVRKLQLLTLLFFVMDHIFCYMAVTCSSFISEWVHTLAIIFDLLIKVIWHVRLPCPKYKPCSNSGIRVLPHRFCDHGNARSISNSRKCYSILYDPLAFTRSLLVLNMDYKSECLHQER